MSANHSIKRGPVATSTSPLFICFSRPLCYIGSMKRALLLVFIFPVIFSPLIFAAEIAPEGTPARKLQRGFLNIALSPISISEELHKEKKADSFIPSWVAGLGRGTCFAAGRALMGVYEMATFFIPVPSGYRPAKTEASSFSERAGTIGYGPAKTEASSFSERAGTIGYRPVLEPEFTWQYLPEGKPSPPARP